jgi:hypothetical protein
MGSGYRGTHEGGGVGDVVELSTEITGNTMTIQRNSADATGAILNFVKSRSATEGSYTILQDNDVVSKLIYLPDDGADYLTEAANFQVEVDDASPAAGDIGCAFVWNSMAGGGAAIAERMRLAASGLLTVPGGISLGTQVTTDALHAFQVNATTVAGAGVTIGKWSADALGAHLDFVKSQNTTVGSNTIVADNDVVGGLRWFPDDGADFATEAAVFLAEVDDTGVGAGDIGMAFVWQQMAGGVALRETLRLSAAGTLTLQGNANLLGRSSFGAPEIYTLDVHGSSFNVNLSSSSASLTDLTSAWVHNSDTAIAAPVMYFARSRNTQADPEVVQDGDALGSIFFSGYDGTDFNMSSLIIATVDGTPGADAMGGKLSIQTALDGTHLGRATQHQQRWRGHCVVVSGGQGIHRRRYDGAHGHCGRARCEHDDRHH